MLSHTAGSTGHLQGDFLADVFDHVRTGSDTNAAPYVGHALVKHPLSISVVLNR